MPTFFLFTKKLIAEEFASHSSRTISYPDKLFALQTNYLQCKQNEFPVQPARSQRFLQ